MKKFYISHIKIDHSMECACYEMKFKSFKECLLHIIKDFVNVDMKEHKDEDIDELINSLQVYQSDGYGSHKIVSIIQEGKGIVYVSD